MKKISAIIATLIATSFGPALAQTTTNGVATAPSSATSGHTVSICVQGVQTQSGQFFIALCDEVSFDRQGGCAMSKIVPIAQINAPVVFQSVPTGNYGVKLFHDVNSNNRLDTNAMGIPREPYAFSNNARGRFGPAKFKDAAFIVNKNTNISMRLESL